MAQTLQKILLLAFCLCALVTVFLQVRYGMLCGRSKYQDKQADPKTESCRKYAVASACVSAACLLLCILLGMIVKYSS